jgi:hypothetical protein
MSEIGVSVTLPIVQGEQKVILGWSPVAFRLVTDFAKICLAVLKQTYLNGQT